MEATWKNLKPGTRVKCVFKIDEYKTAKYGQSARIITADETQKQIVVFWDDGIQRNTVWGRPSSFEIIEDNRFPYAPTEYEANHGGVPITN